MLALFAAVVLPSESVSALDHITIARDGQEQRISGRTLVQAQDGGLMLQGRDGVIWMIQPEKIVGRETDDTAFVPLSKSELAEQLLAELPDGFAVHQTIHYLVCYNTSKAYAEWCGTLFERLYRGFASYWKNRGFELSDPEFPLVAVVFADRESYARLSQDELGSAAPAIIGYYSLRSNRMTMYDLTGAGRAGQRRSTLTTAAQINHVLAQPDAVRTVATVIHEATHQIAFNCGLQTRYADNPLWVSEGIAVYFETPDLADRRGWSTIGAVHPLRLERFRQYLPRRPADSLVTLLTDDDRFRGEGAEDAYAEAWALNYFLLKRYGREYAIYLKRLAAKRPLINDSPETRIAEFEEALGKDLATLDADFLRYMARLR